MSAEKFNLRYAPHVGYLPPFEPMFKHSGGGADLDRQASFIASHGFAGVFHPWVAWRSEDDIAGFESALRRHDLEAGCLVSGALEHVVQPAWVSRDSGVRGELMERVRHAANVASRVGSKTLAVLVMGAPDVTMASQVAAFRDNVRFAADAVSEDGVTLGVEAMVALPGMLFQSVYDLADVLKAADHPGAKLIFDTAHVADMDGDVLAAQEKLGDLVCCYQLADAPGRIEPGSGQIDFLTLLTRLQAENYAGLIELEHGWSADTAECEQAGISALRDLDTRSRRDALAMQGERT